MSRRLAAVVATSALSLGLLAGPAMAATSTPDSSRSGARLEKVCAHLDELKTHWQQAQQRYDEAHGRLVAAQEKAADSGHTKLAERIGKRIAKLEERASKATARHDKIVAACAKS